VYWFIDFEAVKIGKTILLKDEIEKIKVLEKAMN